MEIFSRRCWSVDPFVFIGNTFGTNCVIRTVLKRKTIISSYRENGLEEILHDTGVYVYLENVDIWNVYRTL